MTVSERVYRLMLRLYPATFRLEYSDLMMQAFRDLYREKTRQGVAGMIGLWAYLLVETVTQAVIEYRDAIRNHTGVKVEYTPSKRDLLWVFVPLITIMTFFYVMGDYSDTMVFYLLIVIAGCGGWLLSRFGRFRANPLWNTYMLGIFLGVLTFFAYFGLTLPTFGMYQWGTPTAVVLLAAPTLYVIAVALSGRLVGTNLRLYTLAAILLALTSTAALLIDPRRFKDAHITAIDLNFVLMKTFSVLLLCAFSIWMARFIGRRALILLAIALGVQIIFVDAGYFTGGAGRWINLTTLVFPLILSPTWLWFARTERSRLWGTVLLWVILTAVIVVVPSIARSTLGMDHETPALWTYRFLTALPYLTAMGLALHAAHQQPGHDAENFKSPYTGQSGVPEAP